MADAWEPMGKRELDERRPLIDQAMAEQGRSNADEPSAREGLDLEEVTYAINSFMAVLKPVTVTMVLASIATVYVQSDSIDTSSSLSAYEVYDTSSAAGTSASVRLGESIVNALVVVCVLAAATFGIVLLYKYRCMKCLVGYMMFSSVMLLGAMGGMVLWTLLQKWEVPFDQYTFLFIVYNFGVVGVISIFYQKGIPTGVTQSYLVATSIIMAWQLSRFEDWTGWSLLVVLALYDLCAVLTPCGPLKALVNLMQDYGEPMPGLLYEAALPPSGSSASGSPPPPPGAASGGRGGPPAAPAAAAAGTGVPPAAGAGGGGGGGAGAGAARAYVEEGEGEEEEERSIKLGLGDFVFYSVLVSKAAQFGVVTCVACLLVILAGLGGTLILLSLYRSALPALPISIFLGVTCYLLTRVLVVPYVDALAAAAVYV